MILLGSHRTAAPAKTSELLLLLVLLLLLRNLLLLLLLLLLLEVVARVTPFTAPAGRDAPGTMPARLLKR